ncbi:YetF domain-containing protein [Lentibacillus jeotgali]|uniref:YetF domain-containing protein n=1 Tax=Lentibacillus jeotgali TaxID=558169 RepID=UPI0002628FE3|nr:YetF domain-containing protein [Lentibacillus jeotgali]
MEFDWIWKSVLIVIAGTFLLRLAGRKSISQMTLPQTVIMIGIGSLLIQPVSGNNIWITIAVGAILISTLFVMEYAQVKGNIFEKIITGKSKVLIENGTVNEQNMKKLRMTVDQLEMNLRMKNVKSINDVEWATLEPNGQVGFSLKNDAQPVTKKEFNQLSSDVQQILSQLSANSQINQLRAQLDDLNNQIAQLKTQRDMFKELDEKHHDENPSPKHLQ